MKQEGVYWKDQYAKKGDKELQCEQTCVVDGYGWKVSPSGRTYCSGKVKEGK